MYKKTVLFVLYCICCTSMTFSKGVSKAIDFQEIPDVRIFKGDEKIAYRDPAVWYEDGVFHLFFTVCNPAIQASTLGYSSSTNLVDWTPVKHILPMDKRYNWSSPGNVVKHGDEKVLCIQTYPTPNAKVGQVVWGDETSRLYTLRTKDFKNWSKPELIKVKGPDVSEKEMGRMIDPYILKSSDGQWWCFYKQSQDKNGRFSKKGVMGVPFSVSKDLKIWKQKGFIPGGENVCVIHDKKADEFLMLHSPVNGIGLKRSKDLVKWRDCGALYLGQNKWQWAKGRLSAATVIDLTNVPRVGKYVMFFHGSGPRKEIEGDFNKNASIAIAWSDDLKNWTWPGKNSAPLPVGEHACFESIPLAGGWEMAYSDTMWDSRKLPLFNGVFVSSAVPGIWENMVEVFRRSGMKDEFKINPLYVKQTLPISGRALDTTLPNIYGSFFYRRKFNVSNIKNRDAFLSFECVRNQVHVWVNGKFVAFREGFSTPFELPIPKGILQEGENEIVLAVSNRPNNGYDGKTVSGLTTRAVFEYTGGIEGNVEIRFPRGLVKNCYVTTSKDLKTFTVHVEKNQSNEFRPFSWEISKNEKTVAKGVNDKDFTLSADGFSFWSPENPVLYTLKITSNGATFSKKFGLRRLLTEGEKFRFNGEYVYLRGITEHCYFAETIHPPRDLEYYRGITAKRKELGFNFLRFHTWVPPKEYLTAMDELGMMVHIESPNFVTLDEYRSIVAFARNHPCVVVYCTGNETWIDEGAERYLKSVSQIVHAQTDSLFTPMSAMRNVEYMVPRNRYAQNKPFLHVPSRMKRLADYCDYFTSYQLGATSYDSLNGSSAQVVDAWGDAYCGKPRVSHEICIDGSFCDFTLEEKYPKSSRLVKTGIFSEVRRNLKERGLLSRADTYVKNSAEWMRRIRKFAFEKVRSMKRTMGYDFLGDINSIWHTFGYSVGMMDEFYNLKSGESVQNVRCYNSAAVLLSDLGSKFNVYISLQGLKGNNKYYAYSLHGFFRRIGNLPSRNYAC